MCERCDNKAVGKRWMIWSGVILTLAIFVMTQIYVFGNIVGQFETHKENAPTYRGISEKYVDKDEFDIIKDMILFLYKKEGGQ
jgi:hypothetical protein